MATVPWGWLGRAAISGGRVGTEEQVLDRQRFPAHNPLSHPGDAVAHL